MFDHKHIVITGGAGAIGFEIAKQLRLRCVHAHITLVDINEHELKLKCMQLDGAAYVLWDLFKPEELESAWHTLVADKGTVDLLVNCAGIMDLISFKQTTWKQGWKLLAVNLISPMRLIDLALQSMPAGGGIINIASMAGTVPMAGSAYYSAAKAGIGIASEILWAEAKEQGIRVLTVYPGPIKSGLEKHAREQLKKSWVSNIMPTGTPNAIAKKIVQAYCNNEAVVIFPDIYGIVPWLGVASKWVVQRLGPTPQR